MTGLVRKALAPAVMLTVLGGARAQDASAETTLYGPVFGFDLYF